MDKMKAFNIKDLFDIKRGKTPSKENKVENSGFPYYSNPHKQNGFSLNSNVSGNSIIGSMNGSPLRFNYIENESCAGNDICILTPKFKLNKFNQYLFVLSLNKLSSKYNYGRKLTLNRLNKEKIYLPSTNDGEIDFKYINTLCNNILKQKMLKEIEKLQETIKSLG